MAWLHENREEFFDAVNLAAEKYNVLPTVVEKDYYVTMILRGLSSRLDYVVFKDGTSLSNTDSGRSRDNGVQNINSRV